MKARGLSRQGGCRAADATSAPGGFTSGHGDCAAASTENTASVAAIRGLKAGACRRERATGPGAQAHISLLGAFLLLFLVLAPWPTALSLRISME
ncbi:hypothetical protein [Nitrosovibrio sp. Nv17]|uniref:hypothetical protein n=1 Tax=Nitrosovibrio sp. Nv17 TaxID=1855339 RepID=UPI002101C196|nr:hypothetical protein [Nitrosovibrio sp. Nv17]